jgi:hypothetical protein
MRTSIQQRFVKRFLLLSLLFGSSGVFSQQLFKGTIVDAARDEPIPYATVFLTNTTFGASADEEGRFALNVPKGNYDVIVRMLGYEPLTFSLNTSEIRAQGYRIMLQPLEDELDEIEVEDARDPAWYRNLEIFKSYFLGTSANAKHAKIQNETDLRLDDQSLPRVLTVKATDVLEVENPNLGYRIQYLLTDFRYDRSEGYTFYGGNPLFFPDTTLSPAKLKKVEKAREEAYRGSLQHFIQALYRGKVWEEGFEIRRLDRLPKDGGFLDQLTSEIIDEETLLSREGDGRVMISYDFHLHILYKLEKESIEYVGVMNGKRSSNQSSIMKLEVDSMELYENGGYSNAFGIMVEGYMAWERVADLLPLDYRSKSFGN